MQNFLHNQWNSNMSDIDGEADFELSHVNWFLLQNFSAILKQHPYQLPRWNCCVKESASAEIDSTFIVDIFTCQCVLVKPSIGV